MTKKMLIDATHDEETRVAVVDGRKLVEFDYESKFRKPLKGSIFLAKVTRVEPSLQAAFVNFGGNRHGFLPFAEIHPDYFRIPIADREALLAEQQAMMEEQEAEERAREQEEQQQHEGGDAPAELSAASEDHSEEPAENNVEYVERENDVIEEIGGGDLVVADDSAHEDETAPVSAPDELFSQPREFVVPQEDDAAEHDEEQDFNPELPGASGELSEVQGEGVEGVNEALSEGDENNGEARSEETPEGGGRGRGGRYRRGGGGGRGRSGGGRGRHRMAHRSNRVEKFGGEDYSQEDRFRFNLRRKYKIQEVIKRGQIMLVQVSKEERGNKGAAVSTYLSLPGRYCVLMPNSPRAGGVSRKIANYEDRARMKEIMQEIQVPQGMSVIVRTAGVSRTKPEIKRDLDYLMRLWDNIRELTLQSSAPSKVYEEADLIKRAVRDLFSKDIEEIIVSGEEGFNTATNFMKMMMPTHADRVVQHTEDVPLFTRYHVEDQIVEIGEARVTLPSGGYLIINQTEALVAVDVNSGKATKERHIEETALKTNMEAASEIARQLRLRDLGGLIVIDFIDMEDRRNNGKVERRVRESLSSDRARIQMGRISSFGLMELSRQRLNPSLTESQFEICPHCAGVGRIRTSDAMSIMVLRAIESQGIKGRKGQQVIAHVSNDVAVYLLNNKRKNVTQIESRYGISILIRVDDTVGASSFRIEVLKGSSDSDEDLPEVKHVHVHHDHSDADEGEDSGDDERPQRAERPARAERSDRGDRGDTQRADRPERNEESGERGARRRGRRGGRNRNKDGGRREWRDREDGAPRNPAGEVNANEPNGNVIVSESFSEDDEFEDAAAHQALHDREVVKREAADLSGRPPPREPRADRGDRGGRHRGGRGRGRGGRDRNDSNRPDNRNQDRQDNRPRRESFDSAPPPRNESRNDSPAPQREARQEPNFNSYEGSQPTASPPGPKLGNDVRATAPQKSYETVNPEPTEKKRGWWNRLTE